MKFKVYLIDGTIEIAEGNWREILPSGTLLITTDGDDMRAYAPGQWQKCIQVKE